jgi:hypothetical protein
MSQQVADNVGVSARAIQPARERVTALQATRMDISIVHLLKAADVGIHKSLLLRGQPTSITETIQTDKLTQLLEASLADIIDIMP